MTDLDDIMAWLAGCGLEAVVCDAAVPYYRNGVSAGVAREGGDWDGEVIGIPREWVERHHVGFVVTARGDSMTGAGIEDGDLLSVAVGVDFSDGDVVVACVDGECVVKTFFRDEDGGVWLLPQNSGYEPIELQFEGNQRVLGRVVSVQKGVGRRSYADCVREIREVRLRREARRVVGDDVVRRAVEAVLGMLRGKSMWYGVYAALRDCGYVRGLGDFLVAVERLFPGNGFGLRMDDLGRLDWGCFTKPLERWVDDDSAPRHGGVFEGYRSVGLECKRRLMNIEN